MYHDLYMGDILPIYEPDQFDVNLSTGQLIAKVTHALIDGEKSGDELVIIVRTHAKRYKR